MAKENVKKFFEELSTNKELQEKFLEVQKGYEVEGKSEEEVFADIVLTIAKEAGYEFTMSEYKDAQCDAMAEKGMSEEELENVSGGWSVCVGAGVSSSWFAVCILVGGDTSLNPEGENKGGGGVGVEACIYLGLGIGWTI